MNLKHVASSTNAVTELWILEPVAINPASCCKKKKKKTYIYEQKKKTMQIKDTEK
jgi:hypothetical protein